MEDDGFEQGNIKERERGAWTPGAGGGWKPRPFRANYIRWAKFINALERGRTVFHHQQLNPGGGPAGKAVQADKVKLYTYLMLKGGSLVK